MLVRFLVSGGAYFGAKVEDQLALFQVFLTA